MSQHCNCLSIPGVTQPIECQLKRLFHNASLHINMIFFPRLFFYMVKKNHADIIMYFGGMNIIKRSEATTDRRQSRGRCRNSVRNARYVMVMVNFSTTTLLSFLDKTIKNLQLFIWNAVPNNRSILIRPCRQFSISIFSD